MKRSYTLSEYRALQRAHRNKGGERSLVRYLMDRRNLRRKIKRLAPR